MGANMLIALIRRFLPIAITVAVSPGSTSTTEPWHIPWENAGEFVRFVAEHLFLVVVSLTATVVVGVSLGTLMTRKGFEKTGPAILTIVNIWQSVPSLGVHRPGIRFFAPVGAFRNRGRAGPSRLVLPCCGPHCPQHPTPASRR